MAPNDLHPERRLFVEGNNDLHAVIHVMRTLRPEWDHEARSWIGVKNSGNDHEALKDFELAATANDPLNRVGLVLDADDGSGKSVVDRWQKIGKALARVGVETPASIPREGWVGETARKRRLGVWIMPNNLETGAIEAFLFPLVPPTDSAWQYAAEVVRVAKDEHKAPYAAQHAPKAQLHTWLAWRKEPGRPLGRALEAKDFVPHADPNAARFARWFESLFIAPAFAPPPPIPA
jgi:hypothetical protein